MGLGLALVVAGAFFISIPGARAQQGSPAAPVVERPHGLKERMIPDRFPAQPSQPPNWSIPVEPLGFSQPGPIYMGSRNTLVSLDFISEDKLLFTFRVPGLLHRDAANAEGSDERQIRAVVLALPQ